MPLGIAILHSYCWIMAPKADGKVGHVRNYSSSYSRANLSVFLQKVKLESCICLTQGCRIFIIPPDPKVPVGCHKMKS